MQNPPKQRFFDRFQSFDRIQIANRRRTHRSDSDRESVPNPSSDRIRTANRSRTRCLDSDHESPRTSSCGERCPRTAGICSRRMASPPCGERCRKATYQSMIGSRLRIAPESVVRSGPDNQSSLSPVARARTTNRLRAPLPRSGQPIASGPAVRSAEPGLESPLSTA